MRKQSAGILLYRRTYGIEVLLGHPGGPFYAKKDDGVWSIIKGEYDDDEDAFQAARREFQEETGHDAPLEGEELSPCVSDSGKHMRIWMMEGDLDASTCVSNTLMLEWPPHSGNKIEIPENDRAEWFTAEVAKQKLWPSQRPFIDELVERLEHKD